MSGAGLDEEAAEPITATHELQGTGRLERTDPRVDRVRHPGGNDDRRMEMQVASQLGMGDAARLEDERGSERPGRHDDPLGPDPERTTRLLPVQEASGDARRPARLYLHPVHRGIGQDASPSGMGTRQVRAEAGSLGPRATAEPAAPARGARPGIPLGDRLFPAQRPGAVEDGLVLGRDRCRRAQVQLVAEPGDIRIGLGALEALETGRRPVGAQPIRRSDASGRW